MREGSEGEEEGNNREILGGEKAAAQKRFETKTLIENPNKSIGGKFVVLFVVFFFTAYGFILLFKTVVPSRIAANVKTYVT